MTQLIVFFFLCRGFKATSNKIFFFLKLSALQSSGLFTKCVMKISLEDGTEHNRPIKAVAKSNVYKMVADNVLPMQTKQSFVSGPCTPMQVEHFEKRLLLLLCVL